MSDDDLRDQLVKAWTRHDWDHGRRPETKPWEKLDAKTQQRLTDRIETLHGDRLDDALMPVVREALADAWDDGYRAANDDLTDSLLDPEPDHPGTPNPWREEQP